MISVAFCTFHLIIKIGKETMNNPTSLIYPIVNVIVTALFAGVVLRQYLQRHRVYQLYWSIALTMAFVATLAYVCMVVVGPTSAAGVALFRLYYILGAALMAAWLRLGSLALVTKHNVARLGLQNTLWLIMAFGWCVFFVGVLLAGRRTVRADRASQEASRRTARA